MTIEKEALAPCPFCGRHLINPEGYAAVVMVHPQPYEGCPAWGIVVHTDMPERVAMWNRRTPSGRAGEGWVMVPVEPTGAMWSAGKKAFEIQALNRAVQSTYEMQSAYSDRAPEIIWAAMLAAAPNPPASDKKEG